MEAYRASILHFTGDPTGSSTNEVVQYFDDGLLVVEDGQVIACGEAQALLTGLDSAVEVTHYGNCLITPGFIDTHIHYPQTEMIAAYGEQLLKWLETYTFPVESKFSDPQYATGIAERFLDELLRCGTTTALVFGTVHPASVDSFFEACERRNLRMIAGKVMMDRNAPADLLDTALESYEESKALIEKWHNRGRARYAITPRFAPTSSPEQLQYAGRLLKEYPDAYLQTHISENLDEIEWVKALYPQCQDYLDTYDQAGLLGRRSVFAHCIHLSDREWSRLAQSDSNIAFCPTSNLFLGSGLFNLKRAMSLGLRVGLGTDVGGGTSFSMLQTMAEAYKVAQLRQEQLTPLKAFYIATLGGACALDLEDRIGNFETGKEADFVILDKGPTPLLAFRSRHCSTLEETLFVMATLGDDRSVLATYSAGVRVHQRQDQRG